MQPWKHQRLLGTYKTNWITKSQKQRGHGVIVRDSNTNTIALLINWLRVGSWQDTVGRPILYGTTDEFLVAQVKLLTTI